MNKSKFNDIIKALDGLHESFDHLRSVTSSGPASYYFERMKDYYDGCMKAAKFKKGSRIQLKEDVDTNDKPGWEHCKHFLIKGAKATIRDVDYMNGKYVYDLEFDNESWIKDYEGFTKLKKPVEVPIEDKHVFRFTEKHLEKA
jgi:hypothetical protein